jgi:hypothetical protein
MVIAEVRMVVFTGTAMPVFERSFIDGAEASIRRSRGPPER